MEARPRGYGQPTRRSVTLWTVTSDSPPVRALLFDFDGTMLDTESSSYGSWQELLAEHDYDLTHDTWSAAVGTIDGLDPVELLEDHLGAPVDRGELLDRQAARHREMLTDEVLRPGIQRIVDEARARGVHMAIVTSASERWVREHLERLGLEDDWELIVAANGDPERAKPAPLLYEEALGRLGVGPEEAIAIEDSPNGVSAAKAAGIATIAFPNAITAAMDLTHADAIVDDFDGLGVDDLLERVGRPPA
jgi:HAD superfamily hydrolase (TIGR01509 family)